MHREAMDYFKQYLQSHLSGGKGGDRKKFPQYPGLWISSQAAGGSDTGKPASWPDHRRGGRRAYKEA